MYSISFLHYEKLLNERHSFEVKQVNYAMCHTDVKK